MRNANIRLVLLQQVVPYKTERLHFHVSSYFYFLSGRWCDIAKVKEISSVVNDVSGNLPELALWDRQEDRKHGLMRLILEMGVKIQGVFTIR